MRTLRELVALRPASGPTDSVRALADRLRARTPGSLRELLDVELESLAHVDALTCMSTRNAAFDSCRLEFFADGTLEPTLRFKLGLGIEVPVDLDIVVSEHLVAKLWVDDDSTDADDVVGSIDLPLSPNSLLLSFFERDDAKYMLRYSMSVVARTDRLSAAVDAFVASEVSGVWPKIAKAALIDDLKKNLAAPQNEVRQAGTPLCGPAAIVFELIRIQPLRYVRMCRELYETGRYVARTRTIEPSETLRSSEMSKGPNPITAADWLVMASMRDAENVLFAIDESIAESQTPGMTTPIAMEKWSFEILGCDQSDFESTFLSGELDAMTAAEKAVSTTDSTGRRGLAFLLISASLVGNPESIVDLPDHWVTYVGKLAIGTSTIQFQCHSWNAVKQVDVSFDDFTDQMWGAVLVTP